MRKVVLSTYVSLDGVMENPAWTMPFWSDELAKYAHNQLFASNTLLLGRVTYEGFAGAWPSMTDGQGFAERMNALPKFVASTTLGAAKWNATLIKEDVAAEVARLRQRPGRDILIYGSSDLVHTRMPHNLIDEYRLWVHPVVVGTGKTCLPRGERRSHPPACGCDTVRLGRRHSCVSAGHNRRTRRCSRHRPHIGFRDV